MNIRNRLLNAVITVVASTVLLSGCSISDIVRPAPAPAPTVTGGITYEEAVALLNAVPGLRDAEAGSTNSGLSFTSVVEVYVDDEAAIAAPGVLDFIFKVGWATYSDGRAGLSKTFDLKPESVRLTVRMGGETLKLQDQADGLSGAECPRFTFFSACVYGGDYLGAWPGAVPALPEA